MIKPKLAFDAASKLWYCTYDNKRTGSWHLLVSDSGITPLGAYRNLKRKLRRKHGVELYY